MFFAFFRRIEVDLHDLIVYTNKWTVNPNRQGFDHETDCTTQHRPISRSTTSPIAKNCGALLTFALRSPIMEACANGCHTRFGFNLYPSVAPTNAALIHRHWS
jgi:hypothetical protein